MQMSNQLNKTKNKFNIRKSQVILIGSFLVFIGIIFLSWNSFLTIRDEVYSDLKIDIGTDTDGKPIYSEVPAAEEVNENSNTQPVEEEKKEYKINYDIYKGVLEIPKIGLKRGFFGTDHPQNDIEHNVTTIKGSSMPDVPNGNLMLIAHSGDAYISYFAYLWRLGVGDVAYVTYNKKQYKYRIVNIYDVPKVGHVTINRNYDKTTLTMITCTKDNDYTQTIYIAEMEE